MPFATGSLFAMYINWEKIQYSVAIQESHSEADTVHYHHFKTIMSTLFTNISRISVRFYILAAQITYG